ncbi:MAG: septum formation initiator family protein [Pseudomonadota bacterium]
MPTRVRRRSRFAALLLPAVLTLLAFYFGWQSTRGAYSSEARQELALQRAEEAATLARLVRQREALEARVERLRTDQLDADLLDERARAKLNMAHGDELVILHTVDAASPTVALAASNGPQ